jgi:hypothetical protein
MRREKREELWEEEVTWYHDILQWDVEWRGAIETSDIKHKTDPKPE